MITFASRLGRFEGIFTTRMDFNHVRRLSGPWVYSAFSVRLQNWVILCAFVFLASICQSRADDVLPKPVPADRYNKMAAHSPFTPPTTPVATPPPQVAPPPPSWLDKLSVNMLMQDHGVFYATVVDQDSPTHIYLSSDKEDPDSHMAIASVKWDSENHDETPIITLRRGTDFGQVRYEPGTSSGPGMVIQPRPGVSGAAPNNFRVPQPAPAIPGQLNQPQPTNAANAALRRGPIRAVPQAPAPGGRPVVLPGNNPAVQPVRPVSPQIKTDDDDDDD